MYINRFMHIHIYIHILAQDPSPGLVSKPKLSLEPAPAFPCAAIVNPLYFRSTVANIVPSSIDEGLGAGGNRTSVLIATVIY